MQDCFRQHPDVYGAELEDDDEPSAEPKSEQPQATQADASAAPSAAPDEKRELAKQARDQVKSAGEVAESDEVIPKAWHESEGEKKPEQQTEK